MRWSGKIEGFLRDFSFCSVLKPFPWFLLSLPSSTPLHLFSRFFFFGFRELWILTSKETYNEGWLMFNRPITAGAQLHHSFGSKATVCGWANPREVPTYKLVWQQFLHPSPLISYAIALLTQDAPFPWYNAHTTCVLPWPCWHLSVRILAFHVQSSALEQNSGNGAENRVGSTRGVCLAQPSEHKWLVSHCLLPSKV